MNVAYVVVWGFTDGVCVQGAWGIDSGHALFNSQPHQDFTGIKRLIKCMYIL